MTTQPITISSSETEIRTRVPTDVRSRGASSANSPLAGTLWLAGWLFTIAFAKLVWWKGILALVLWPYFLGVVVR